MVSWHDELSGSAGDWQHLSYVESVVYFAGDVSADCFTAGYLQIYDSRGEHLETYRERVQGAVIEESFTFADCYDDSAHFSPPLSHVTNVHVELVCIVCRTCCLFPI